MGTIPRLVWDDSRRGLHGRPILASAAPPVYRISAVLRWLLNRRALAMGPGTAQHRR